MRRRTGRGGGGEEAQGGERERESVCVCVYVCTCVYTQELFDAILAPSIRFCDYSAVSQG